MQPAARKVHQERSNQIEGGSNDEEVAFSSTLALCLRRTEHCAAEKTETFVGLCQGLMEIREY